MRVCFYTLGCKVNLNETGALEQMFRANGFTIAQENEPADVFVVNSCTVTNFGDQKSRKWLRRKKRENPGAVTVLTGCYPQAFPEEAAQFTEADLVCGNGDRKAILDNVLKLLDGHERIVAITPHQRGEKFEELPVERFETHTRAFIKVEDGCNRQCAYCVIPPGPRPGAQPRRSQHPCRAAPAGGFRLPRGGAQCHLPAQLWSGYRHQPCGAGGALRSSGRHPAHPSGQSGPGYAHAGVHHPPCRREKALPAVPPEPAERLHCHPAPDAPRLHCRAVCTGGGPAARRLRCAPGQLYHRLHLRLSRRDAGRF